MTRTFRDVHSVTEADAEHRLALRLACESLPTRARCKRCRTKIPEGKRRDAVYCSEECKAAFRWEQRNSLVREIRVTVRTAKVVPACVCGAPLRTDVRPGPVPKQCKRCYMREAMRRHRKAGVA